MKLINLIRTAVIGCSLMLFAGITHAQVIGGAPKAGNSVAGVNATPVPAESPAVENAADTNRKNAETAATGDKKAAKENKAEDAEKAKVKKQKKQKKTTTTSDETSSGEKSMSDKSATDSSSKAEPSPH